MGTVLVSFFQTVGQGTAHSRSGQWDSLGVGFGSKAEFMPCDKKNPFQSTGDQHDKLTCGIADIPDDNKRITPMDSKMKINSVI